jgi:cellulose synthase/poly-beta-1,6-N-acetylglucosamine synthase-like glycosyltransferase
MVITFHRYIFVPLFLIRIHLQVVFVVCVLFLSLQVIYLSLFLFAFLKKRKKEKLAAQPVSVIVCAHDEEDNLRELVPLLLRQDHPLFEVIVVEDRCNDGTFDYLLEETKKDSRLKMVRVVQKPDHIQGKKFGLTLGIKAAQYDWVLLTDADCRPSGKQWIKHMSEYFNPKTQIVLGFSSYQRTPGLLNSFIRFETLLTALQYMGFALLGKPYMGVGRNLAYRKSLFLDNKGFSTHLDVTGGDDDLFVNRHATAGNTRIAIGKEALVYSKPKTTLKEFYYQKLRHLAVGKHYRFSSKVLLGLFSLSWIGVWLFVLPVIVFSPGIYWLPAFFVLRWIVLMVLLRVGSRKMGDPVEAWKTPFLDFIYAFYYLVAGSVALVSKKVRWKM